MGTMWFIKQNEDYFSYNKKTELLSLSHIMKKEGIVGMSFWHTTTKGLVDIITKEISTNLNDFPFADNEITPYEGMKEDAKLFKSIKIGDRVAVYCEGLIMSNMGDEKFDDPHFMIGEIVGEMETLPIGDDKLSMQNWVRSYFLRHRYKTKWFKKAYVSKATRELEEPISIFSHLRESESSGRRIFRFVKYYELFG